MTASTMDEGDDRLDTLPQPERFLLQSLRAWACCCRGRRLPAETVRRAFAAIGIPAGACALDAAMTRLVLDTRRPLAVHCPPHGSLTADEWRLLAAAAAAQEHDPGRSCRLLADLLPVAAAETVAAALTDLGFQLAAAGLPLSERRAATAERPTLH